MKIRELKEIIKDVGDDEELLVTIPEFKYVHHVNEIIINPVDAEGENLQGVLIVAYKHY